MTPEELKFATKVAQSVMRINGPVAVDGVWGNNTQAAFKKSSVQSVIRGSMKTVNPRATPEAAYSAFAEPKAPSRDDTEVINIITSVSREFGEAPNVLIAKAKIESGLNPNAVNGSYAGLFQMGEAAWADARVQLKLKGYPDVGAYSENKFDARQNARAACAYRIALRAQLRANGFTGPLSEGALYLAHQQGANGFVSLIKAGQTGRLTARQIQAMEGNPPQDGKGVTVNPSEFLTRWERVTQEKFSV